MPNVHELIRDHVTLSIRCLDRLYLHAYMPKLHLRGLVLLPPRSPGPSDSLAGVVRADAGALRRRYQDVCNDAGRAADCVRTRPTERRRGGRISRRRPVADGVVVIGVAQEKMRAFKAHKRSGPQGGVTFDFSRQSVAVNRYYFDVQDPERGPAFLKFGTYLAYPGSQLQSQDGHEWVTSEQLDERARRDAWTVSTMAFRADWADPTRLQAICDQLGPMHAQAYLRSLGGAAAGAHRDGGHRSDLYSIGRPMPSCSVSTSTRNKWRLA